jgi:hypothetical protein
MNHPSDVDLSLGDPGWMRAGAGIRGQGSVSVTAFGVHGGFSLTPSPLPGEMPHSMGFTESITCHNPFGMNGLWLNISTHSTLL